jgi:16S rRNA (cytosine967-C5)-methyltransferase
MTPAARLAAAAEVLDQLAATRAPAQAVLRSWGAAHRFAGSKDRRAIGDRVFLCLRDRGRLSAAGGGEDGRTLVLFSLAVVDGLGLEEIEQLFSGEGYGPPPLSEAERARLSRSPETACATAGLPAFVAEDLKRQFGDRWTIEAEALLGARAPVDLRVNGARTSRENAAEELRAAGLEPAPTPWSAWGLRLASQPSVDIQSLSAFEEGRIEIQDEGSQLAAWLADARPGQLIIDYCAGGGGKTLALAQAGQAGDGVSHLIACDVHPRRLEAIRPRLARAGVTAELRALGPEGQGMDDLAGRGDLVFVDAPCSGSGTWRRHPEAAWRLDLKEVERLHQLQAAILGQAARLVRPGGRLVYVSCSVLARENGDSIATFAETHPGFSPSPLDGAVANPNLTPDGRARLAELAASGHTLQLTPARTQTDGFFIAAFTRTA